MLEGLATAIGEAHLAGLQIDGHAARPRRQEPLYEGRPRRRWAAGRSSRRCSEDVSHGRGHHGPEPEVYEGPGRVLADEPQPKLSPVTKICAPRAAGVLSTKSALGAPPAS